MHIGQYWLDRVSRLRSHLSPQEPDPVLSWQACRADSGSGKVVVTAEDAVSFIGSGAVVSVGGFVGIGVPECLLVALRETHDRTGAPSALTLINVAAGGDSKGRGL